MYSCVQTPEVECLTYRDKKKKMSAMWQTKNQYTPGEWNVQSVMLGGLGKDPELTGQSSSPFNSMPYFRHIYTYIYQSIQ